MELKRYTATLLAQMDTLKGTDEEFHLWAENDLEAQVIAAREAKFLSGEYSAGNMGCYGMVYTVKSIVLSAQPEGKYSD